MPTIDIQKLSKAITDKYSIVSNAFKLDNIKNAELDLYTNEPKDEINVEIGDTKQTEFYPQVKLSRWTNETNFSLRLIDTDYDKAKVETKDDKIVWDKGNVSIEFYDHNEDEGGYKMVWYLKSKPLTNKVEFSIQSKGLDFFYQPELTAEEIAQGAERPENVVGSYAVYHSTKGGMVDGNGKSYATGKAFHIYRPHLFDANGLEAWGNLHIENGIYSVEIPQDFLDKAVYPIKSNDTFGNTTTGTSNYTVGSNSLNGIKYNSPAGTNVATNITSSVIANTGSGNIKGVLVLTSTKVIVTNGVGDGVSVSTKDWYVSPFSINPSLTESTSYILMFVNGGASGSPFGFKIYYDQATGGNIHIDSSNSYTTPTNPNGTDYNNDLRFSIYATYTASASGPAKLKTWNGLATAKIKTINGLEIAKVKTINGLT